jgi:PLP dependent protein
MSSYLQFKENFSRELALFKKAPSEVHLIAASKYGDAGSIRNMFMEGQRDFGENRLQEALPKMEALSDLNITWHFIGHIQTNKIKKIVEKFSILHSVDSLKIAVLLNQACLEKGKILPAFIQVNLAQETSKSGYVEQTLLHEFKELLSLPHLHLQGLMMITPLESTPEKNRRLFRRLGELKQELNEKYACNMPFLSMGMSEDWKEALAEGATHLRIGRAFFL